MKTEDKTIVSDRLKDIVSQMQTRELQAIYLFGSKTGKKYAKAELLKRGNLRNLNWFQKLFMSPFKYN